MLINRYLTLMQWRAHHYAVHFVCLLPLKTSVVAVYGSMEGTWRNHEAESRHSPTTRTYGADIIDIDG